MTNNKDKKIKRNFLKKNESQKGEKLQIIQEEEELQIIANNNTQENKKEKVPFIDIEDKSLIKKQFSLRDSSRKKKISYKRRILTSILTSIFATALIVGGIGLVEYLINYNLNKWNFSETSGNFKNFNDSVRYKNFTINEASFSFAAYNPDYHSLSFEWQETLKSFSVNFDFVFAKCSGSYLGEGFFLTAKHCIYDFGDDLDFLKNIDFDFMEKYNQHVVNDVVNTTNFTLPAHSPLNVQFIGNYSFIPLKLVGVHEKYDIAVFKSIYNLTKEVLPISFSTKALKAGEAGFCFR